MRYLLTVFIFLPAFSNCTDSQSSGEATSGHKAQLQSISNAFGAQPIPHELLKMLCETAPQDFKDMLVILAKAHERRFLQWDGEHFQKMAPKRVLLVGPPGAGKSSLAICMAQMLDCELIFIRAPMLGNEYQNSEVSNLAQVFNLAFESTKPVILVLDEINILAEPKKVLGGNDTGTASVLWLLLDKCAQYPHILVVGTCNDATKLPAQLKDRFIGNIIEIPASNEQERFRILKYYCDYYHMVCLNDVLSYFAWKTEGFSARQLEVLIVKAHQASFFKRDGHPVLLKKHLDEAYQKLVKSSQLMENKKTRLLELMEKYSYTLPYISFGMQATALVGTAVYYIVFGNRN
ncbi:hypothetical protein BH09DEP1_BH09DEP1_6010 [soil metagenome]